MSGTARIGRSARRAGAVLAVALLLISCARLLLDWPRTSTPRRAAGGAPPGDPFARLRASPASSASLRLLERNDEAWVARWQLLASARHRVDVAYFILSQDVFGLAFLGHLVARAEAGVTVRMLVDAGGLRASRTPDERDCLPVAAATRRTTIKRYRPVSRRLVEALATLSPAAAVASNHDKLVVADKRRTILGGRNIAAEYFAPPADEPDVFTDMDVLIDDARTASAVTGVLDALYRSDESSRVTADGASAECRTMLREAYAAMDAWLHGDPPPAPSDRSSAWWRELEGYPHLRGALARRPTRTIVAETRVVDSVPRLGEDHDPVNEAFFGLLARAKRNALLVTPYLVLTEDAAAALAAADARGVQVTVLTNSSQSSDNALSQRFFMEQWPRLLAHAGSLRIYVVGGVRNAHAKFAVFDDALTMLGSNNLDPLSLSLNGELAIVVRSTDFAALVGARSRRALASGPPAVFECRIERDRAGQPVQDGMGRPVVAHGPRERGCTEAASTASALLVSGAARLPGVPPLF